MSDNQNHSNLALAALFASMAKTLGESDPTFIQRLNNNLDHAYYKLRDSGSDTLGALETLKNVQELLKP